MAMHDGNLSRNGRFALTKGTSSEILKIFTSKRYKCV